MICGGLASLARRATRLLASTGKYGWSPPTASTPQNYRSSCFGMMRVAGDKLSVPTQSQPPTFGLLLGAWYTYPIS